MKFDLKKIKSYGDCYDGSVQLSFTLPIKCSGKAKEAAKKYVEKMGFKDVMVHYMKDIGENFTFFIVYGKAQHTIDVTKIKVEEAKFKKMDMYKIDDLIKKKIGRKLVVVGACIESDAHSIGIDAIMNMKGFHGNYGLERYKWIKAYNMGAQVPCVELVKKIREVNADIVLVSQVVTQRNIHIKNLTKLVELLEAENLRDKIILICGGPRITHKLALELGYDAGFGPGTVASDVASFFVQKFIEKHEL